MKKISFLLLLSLFFEITLAQVTSKEKELAEKVKNLFNEKKFSEAYALFNAEIQKTLTEEKFLLTSKDLMNQMLQIKSVSHQEGSRYLLDCQQTPYVMYLATDKEGKISMLFFKPQKAEKTPSTNPLKTDLDKKIDKYLGYLMQNKGTVGASVAIIKNGKAHFYHYGEVKKGSKILPNNNSIYEIGSITKTFTATLAVIAEQEGKLRLEDEVSKFLPDSLPRLAFNSKAILVKNLLNHTSGLPRMPLNFGFQENFEARNPFRTYTKADLFFFFKKFKPYREPEKSFEYSNLAFGFAGFILESLYQKDYETLLKEKMLNPLKMEHTHTRFDKKWESFMVQGYNDKEEENPVWDFDIMAAAGAIRSNLTDMALYAQNLLKTNNPTLQKAFEKTLATSFQNEQNEIGLAWFKKESYYWHNGATGGYCSFLAFDKNSQTAVVLLLNCSANFFEMPLAFSLMKTVINEK